MHGLDFDKMGERRSTFQKVLKRAHKIKARVIQLGLVRHGKASMHIDKGFIKVLMMNNGEGRRGDALWEAAEMLGAFILLVDEDD